MRKKLTIKDLSRMKAKGEKVSFITSYDAQIARIAENNAIDLILVGDSVGNNVLGYDSTIPVTMDMMIHHASAVRRGAPNTFIIGDMPFGSYQGFNELAIHNAARFIKEARMDAVKCEGGIRMSERVKAMSDAGIAVMGHIGYTPQSTNLEGVVQSKTLDDFEELYDDAKSLQEAGAFSILLEAVPNYPSSLIAKKLRIPIYGIGAGRDIDGILAIVNDVIGLGTFKSKFTKPFCNIEETINDGLSKYIQALRNNKFPGEEHFYPISKDEEEKIRDKYKGDCLSS